MSDYPAALDSLSTDWANSTKAKDIHPALHNDVNASVNAIQETLGTNPQGAYDTVAQRLLNIAVSQVYRGTWDASSNTPELADGVGEAGDFYRASSVGTQDLGSGEITFTPGDLVVYDGSTWQRITGTIDETLFVDAQMMGAAADADEEGGGTDDTVALQAAIDKAIELGRPLYLPAGKYRITSGLVAAASEFCIVGAGARVTRIVPDASSYHALSIGIGEGPNNGPSGYARDFGIAGGNAETLKAGAAKATGKAALHLNSMAVFEINNVRVSGSHDIGFDLENNCYGTILQTARTEYDACRVAVNLRTGAENGEDILFLNCWLSGEVCSIHATAGKNYRVISGQLSGSRNATEAEDLRGVVILGKDYLTGEVGFDTAMTLEGASFEYFQQCWAIRAFKQVILKADASFNASGEEPALGFFKNSEHAASQILLDACLFENDFSAGPEMVVKDNDGSGSAWSEWGSWGPYKDAEGETNALVNNMARRCEIDRAYGNRDGNIFMLGEGLELRENDGSLEISNDYGETWRGASIGTEEDYPATSVLTIGSSASAVFVTGETPITEITPTVEGHQVVFRFGSPGKVTDGGNLRLAGDFEFTDGDALTLVCNGTNWFEVSRSVN